jgi:hypothetical protein
MITRNRHAAVIRRLSGETTFPIKEGIRAVAFARLAEDLVAL